MTRHALVTGGAGFIGSHLVDLLIAQGHSVTVLDDFSVGKKVNLEAAAATGRLRVVRGSVLEPADVREAVSSCATVYHLAVKSVRHSLGNPRENHAVNATGTLNALEAARQANVKRFVYCSSSEVYGNTPDLVMREDTTVCRPTTVYGGAKLAGEHYTAAYLQTYGLPTVIVRPFNAYGPRSHMHGESGEVVPRFFARAINNLPSVIFGDGGQTRDFTYVTDTAVGIARAGEVDAAIGQIINIAHAKPISISELARQIAVLARSNAAPVFEPARPGDLRALWGYTRKSFSVLGFRAQVDLMDGLSRYYAWLQGEIAREPHMLNDVLDRNWALA